MAMMRIDQFVIIMNKQVSRKVVCLKKNDIKNKQLVNRQSFYKVKFLLSHAFVYNSFNACVVI